MIKNIILAILALILSTLAETYLIEHRITGESVYAEGVEDGLYIMMDREYQSYLDGIKEGRQSCGQVISIQIN